MNNIVFTDNESNATLQDVLVLRLGLMNHHLLDLTHCLTWNSQWESFHWQTHVVCHYFCLSVHHAEYNLFKEAMDFAILNSPCFRQP